MPTFGWVREDALEAFLSGTEKVPELAAPATRIFKCPFCSTTLTTSRLLQDHIASHHRIERPILLVGGVEPADDQIIRVPHPPRDFVTTNSTSVAFTVDGQKRPPISSEELARELSELRMNGVTVSLSNCSERMAAPAVSIYNLRFRIASRAELQRVERVFMNNMVDGNLSLQLVDKFLADPRCSGPARDYAEAMANYVVGVLIKERPDGQYLTLPYSRYRELFGAALDAMAPQDRPYARLLCAIIRFALNDFSTVYPDAGFWELDLATSMLRGPTFYATFTKEADRESRVKACPIDHGAARILEFAVRMSEQNRWSAIRQDECRQVARSEAMDNLDREKALAIWAVTALRLDAKQAAAEPLAQLSATYPFGRWAGPLLETVTQ
jgi:hypothetical protein